MFISAQSPFEDTNDAFVDCCISQGTPCRSMTSLLAATQFARVPLGIERLFALPAVIELVLLSVSLPLTETLGFIADAAVSLVASPFWCL